jgi:hypothetical protein
MRLGRPRIFTDAECAELWRRYKAGESVLGIGRALCRDGLAFAAAVQRFAACSRVREALRLLSDAALQGC